MKRNRRGLDEFSEQLQDRQFGSDGREAGRASRPSDPLLLSLCPAKARQARYLLHSQSQGQVIGITGRTGHATGPHLYFGITEDGEWVDPLKYLTDCTKAGESERSFFRASLAPDLQSILEEDECRPGEKRKGSSEHFLPLLLYDYFPSEAFFDDRHRETPSISF